MDAEIIAVGSELLTPHRVDTNSLYLTDRLNALGIEVRLKTIVGDDRARLADVIRAVDGPLVYVRDARPSDIEYLEQHEALATLWVALRANVRAVLEATTIADLATGSLPASVQAIADEPRAWQNSSSLGD